eukprot:jgi/Undpi1/6221/HiC_scaffold_20.g08705.m1
MEEHPGCRYSTSASKECSSTNGSFTCETIRRVFRNCPGVRPEQVYDITTKDSGTVAGSSQSPHSGGGGDGEPAHERKNPKRDRSATRDPFGIFPPEGGLWGGMGSPDDLIGSIQDKIDRFFKDNPFPHPDAEFFGGNPSAELGWRSNGANPTPDLPPPHKDSQSRSQDGTKKAPGGPGVSRV